MANAGDGGGAWTATGWSAEPVTVSVLDPAVIAGRQDISKGPDHGGIPLARVASPRTPRVPVDAWNKQEKE